MTIPDSEFPERTARVQQAMRENDWNVLLAASTKSEPAHARYFSDYWPSFETAAVLIPASGEPTLLIGPESKTFAASRSKIANQVQLIDFRESSQPNYPGSKLPRWEDVLSGHKASRIGIAGWDMFSTPHHGEPPQSCPRLKDR